MERIMRIMGQYPLRQAVWQSPRTGETVLIKSKEFVLCDGLDCLTAEAQDELAERLEAQPVPTDSVVAVHVDMCVREWEDKQGQKQRQTKCRIRKMAVL